MTLNPGTVLSPSLVHVSTTTWQPGWDSNMSQVSIRPWYLGSMLWFVGPNANMLHQSAPRHNPWGSKVTLNPYGIGLISFNQWVIIIICSRWSSLRWMAKLIKQLWNMAWDMWPMHCNGVFHNLVQACTDILEHDINQQITVIYASGPQALPRDPMHFLQTPLETTQKLPLPWVSWNSQRKNMNTGCT